MLGIISKALMLILVEAKHRFRGHRDLQGILQRLLGALAEGEGLLLGSLGSCLLYTSPSPRDRG